MRNHDTLIIMGTITLAVTVGHSPYRKGRLTLSTNQWFCLKCSNEFLTLSGKPISEIKLRQSIDSVQWAIFDDIDLTTKWFDYINTLELRLQSSFSSQNKINGGGGRVVDIQIDNCIFTFIFIDMKHLIYNNRIYEIKSEMNCPFDETYNAAINRNGVVTPWG